MSWQEQLWTELEDMEETEQIVAAGEWITYVTRDLLPALGRHRRSKILEVLARPGWDSTVLAETIGSKRNTINRLAEEGRAQKRSERLASVRA